MLPFQPMEKALASLLKTGDYSDLTIICGNDRYAVHKAIVCPRSHFFKAACDGEFREAQTGEINLPDDDPVAVRMMISYFYYDAYEPPQPLNHGAQPNPGPVSEASSALITQPNHGAPPPYPIPLPVTYPSTFSNFCLHAKVYALGEKYGIQSLKAVAFENFKYETQVCLLGEDFTYAIKEVYTSTVDEDRSLRELVIGLLKARPSWFKVAPMQEVVKDIPELSYDLLVRYVREDGERHIVG